MNVVNTMTAAVVPWTAVTVRRARYAAMASVRPWANAAMGPANLKAMKTAGPARRIADAATETYATTMPVVRQRHARTWAKHADEVIVMAAAISWTAVTAGQAKSVTTASARPMQTAATGPANQTWVRIAAPALRTASAQTARPVTITRAARPRPANSRALNADNRTTDAAEPWTAADATTNWHAQQTSAPARANAYTHWAVQAA